MIRKNSFYIFQKEFYNIGRFFYYIITKYPTLRHKKLGHTDYTKKLRTLIIISLLFQMVSIGWVYRYTQNSISIILTIIIMLGIYPFYLIIAQWCILPLEYILKKRIIQQAKKKLQTLQHLHIIGIVGSYGKTSTKHVLYHTYKNIVPTITTSGNTNTLLGVAKFILQEVQAHHHIVIVEMGEHYAGDIKDLCNLLNPQTIIVSGLTLQHVERMGNIDQIEKVLFEFRGYPSVRHVIINEDDQHLKERSYKYITNGQTIVDKISTPSDIQTIPQFGGSIFMYENNIVKSRLLGKHAVIFSIIALHIGKYLNLSTKNMIQQIKNIPYIDHRLQLIYNPISDIYVIDDSYNGNIQGVQATIQLIKDTQFDGKKIYITPGLMELGLFSEQIHTQIAQLINGVFDMILLIENSNTKYIYKKLIEQGANKEKIIMFADRDIAHATLKEYTSHHSVIIFQNDIPKGF